MAIVEKEKYKNQNNKSMATAKKNSLVNLRTLASAGSEHRY
jgi:hypothetical protein